MKKFTKIVILIGIVSVLLYYGSSALAQSSICPCVSSMTPVNLSGKIDSVTFPMAVLKTSGGEVYNLRLGPWWFWKEKGYSLKANENVEVEGYQAANLIVPKVIRSTSGEIRLRDDNGYPLWGTSGPKGGRGRWNQQQ